ncbi:MAG: hypothetical protein KBS60_04165 [Phascolarctobacterium sp.]|nr:hypothetical protein [Candidatus Phascolarctobacterium caballi]
MSCKTSCRLCKHLILSTSIAYSTTTGAVSITIPTASYNNGEKYCIVLAQALPATAVINAPVFIVVGTNSYQLTTCDCQQVTISALRTRTRYSTRVVTSATGGTFKLLGKLGDCTTETLPAIGG